MKRVKVADVVYTPPEYILEAIRSGELWLAPEAVAALGLRGVLDDNDAPGKNRKEQEKQHGEPPAGKDTR